MTLAKTRSAPPRATHGGVIGRQPVPACGCDATKAQSSEVDMREHRIGDHSRLASKERIGSTTNREVGVAAELLSAIRNLVCPECGGPMGGRAKEFQCRGQCGTDWRSVWELVTA